MLKTSNNKGENNEKAEEEAVYRYSLYLEKNNVDNRYEVEWNPQINKYCQFGKAVDFEV